MKPFSLIAYVLISITLLVSSCANDDSSPPIDNFDRAKMDLLFSTLEERDLTMGAASIFKNGKEIYQKSFGMADLANTIAINSQTKFKIGSITKTFTAAMIMQLVEEGKLTLNTLLSDYYPEMPNSSVITTENLLRHRSGLFNYTDDPDLLNWGTQPITETEFIERFTQYGTIHEPNVFSTYSNTNYVILGFLIEKIDGKTYSEALKDRITDPINLTNTYYFGETINTSNNECLSYGYWNDTWNLAPQIHASVSAGSGSIMSTPTDLNIFYNALFHGGIVSLSSLDEMTKSISNIVCIGLFPNVIRIVKPDFGHYGAIDGFNSVTAYFPEEDLCMSYISSGINFQNSTDLEKFNLPYAPFDIYFGYNYTIPLE
ncbi:serine hydrolase domain-containing protein [Ascidiimonas sp. W6]|uniref:serine hydrolase domain-containing protein n=1 Tax=Ascidiimonas meishanensis TaxID=3128903 RepID=UPI0030EB6B43